MSAVLHIERVDAVIFDMDGVVTETVTAHAAAWKRLFDGYLAERAKREDRPFVPFDADEDYRRYLDGKARVDGVRSFLVARGISLPEGRPSDPPDLETVNGLGNRKNDLFLDHLREHGAEPYASTVQTIRRLTALGIRTAVISASKNMEDVLDAAGVIGLFDVRVDGQTAEELGLPGKPDPAVFLEAARRLAVGAGRAAVVEDALAGVAAGRRGGFALVIGVDRSGHPDALLEAGADVVVPDLADLEVVAPAVRDLPAALGRVDEIAPMVRERPPVVALDYDGTLTPIVDRPEDALMPEDTRAALRRLAALVPVAILSGRDLADVRSMVGVDDIWYAGSHGFDMRGPGGERHQRGREFLPALDAAERELVGVVGTVPGARLERKAFAIAVHFRLVDADLVPRVEEAVDAVAARHPDLRKTGGKKIFELRPSLAWDKGRALEWLLEALGRDEADVLPVYLGDDETDEDAFRVVRVGGLGVVVRGESDHRPTSARYALEGPAEARAFLEMLASTIAAGAA